MSVLNRFSMLISADVSSRIFRFAFDRRNEYLVCGDFLFAGLEFSLSEHEPRPFSTGVSDSVKFIGSDFILVICSRCFPRMCRRVTDFETKYLLQIPH